MLLAKLCLFSMGGQILRKLEHVHFSTTFFEFILDNAISGLVDENKEEELSEADGSLTIAVD